MHDCGKLSPIHVMLTPILSSNRSVPRREEYYYMENMSPSAGILSNILFPLSKWPKLPQTPCLLFLRPNLTIIVTEVLL